MEAGDGGATEIENPIAKEAPKGGIVVELETVAEGMISPLGLAQPNDGTNRLFIYDQGGLIHVLEEGDLLSEPLLDVRDRLVSLGISGPGSFDERGLLGLALHPRFAENGLLYTYTSEPLNGQADFTTPPLPEGETHNHQSLVAEWRISEENPNRADHGTQHEILRIDQPQFNHNAGTMRFGPDGFLYIVLGDGGNADDQGPGHCEGGNAQNIENLYGGILRIDVDGNDSANGQYGIPPDNPFYGRSGLDEIFAYGLRNPFSFSFDRDTGRLLLADVGQNDLEEVNVIVKGGNYGWNIKEGSFFFNPNGDDDGFVSGEPVGEAPSELIDPIAEYDHDDGLAIIGGFIYRGKSFPSLQGRYVTGDYQTPTGLSVRLFYLDAENEFKEFQIGFDDRPFGYLLKGFGQDADGEIYVFATTEVGPFGGTGRMLKIVPPDNQVEITGTTETADELTFSSEDGVGPFSVQRQTLITDQTWNETTLTFILRETNPVKSADKSPPCFEKRVSAAPLDVPIRSILKVWEPAHSCWSETA